LISNIGSITAGVSVDKYEYADHNSSILISAAPNAKEYQYSLSSLTQESPKLCKKGLATDSHHKAIKSFTAGIFLLYHNALFKDNIHSNLPSALFGV
jgi:hypothetical protein